MDLGILNCDMTRLKSVIAMHAQYWAGCLESSNCLFLSLLISLYKSLVLPRCCMA